MRLRFDHLTSNFAYFIVMLVYSINDVLIVNFDRIQTFLIRRNDNNFLVGLQLREVFIRVDFMKEELRFEVLIKIKSLLHQLIQLPRDDLLIKVTCESVLL